jgi:hypothetical protein
MLVEYLTQRQNKRIVWQDIIGKQQLIALPALAPI